ncbi:hypothetical protein HOY82DRAFT_574772 [Tuber indicum]|nr:hypothetical protein HOY82DRAFT_574772 [Tuber indicum]
MGFQCPPGMACIEQLLLPCLLSLSFFSLYSSLPDPFSHLSFPAHALRCKVVLVSAVHFYPPSSPVAHPPYLVHSLVLFPGPYRSANTILSSLFSLSCRNLSSLFSSLSPSSPFHSLRRCVLFAEVASCK